MSAFIFKMGTGAYLDDDFICFMKWEVISVSTDSYYVFISFTLSSSSGNTALARQHLINAWNLSLKTKNDKISLTVKQKCCDSDMYELLCSSCASYSVPVCRHVISHGVLLLYGCHLMWSDCALLLCYPVGAVILDGFGGKEKEERREWWW